jgi:GNAT superfamily N-acetyltransferase
MKITPAVKEHIDQIRQLSLRYHVLGWKPESDGFTIAVYRPEVLSTVLDESLSTVLLDETGTVAGHFLACSQPGFNRVFNQTMIDDFSEYGHVDIQESSGYGLQVCLDKRVRGTGAYRQFHDAAIERIRAGGITDLFAEISDQNTKSQRVHERFGWRRIASKKSDDVLGFKGNDIKLIEKTYGKMKSWPVICNLYHRGL